MLPNFFIVGAHKAGTTALYKMLDQHPDIYLSEEKEPRYYALKTSDREYLGPNDPAAECKYRDKKTYMDLFVKGKGKKAIGEASTIYLYYADTVAKEICLDVPNARIIVVVRNPIDRAFSNYTYNKRDDRESAKTFRDALNLEDERVRMQWGPLWHYTRKGFYSDSIRSYQKVFGEENVKVVIYDDLKVSPEKTCRDLFQFLNINEEILVDTGLKYNVSGRTRVKFFRNLLNSKSVLKRMLVSLIPVNYRGKLKEKLMQLNLDKKNSSEGKLDHADKFFLKEVYAKEIDELSRITGRDLSCWMRF